MKRAFVVWTLVVVGMGLAAVPVAAQMIGDEALLPVVAHTSGAGNPPTNWVSDVAIHNLRGETITVGMAYFPFDRTNDWDLTFSVTVELAPRETVLIEDVLASKFGITANSKGALEVACSQDLIPSNPVECDLLVASRTYNTGGAEGTYGQTVPANDLLFNGSGTPSYITGARNDGRFRSSLGIVNASFGPTTVHYKFRRPNGAVLKEGSAGIPKLSGKQWLFSQLGIGKVNGPITVELWLDPSDVTADPCNTDFITFFLAYVSKVDGNPDGTGDAEFLPAVPTEMPPVGYDCPDEAE